jgi:fluoroacetyl-CoA thioesterase
VRHKVTDADTAAALGSGDVAVLATPRLIAWMEAATVQSALRFIEAGQTTVGTEIRIGHRRATPVGGSVEITATPTGDAVGRRLTFVVRAVDDAGALVAEGEIIRTIVDRNVFLAAVSISPTAGDQ